MKREESEVLQKAGRVVGIDMCLPSLSRHEGIHELVFGNIEELPFAESSFDVVTANMVVEHLAQPLAVLQETFRVLKPGGVLVLHAPNYWNPLTLIASLTPQRVKNLLLRLFEGRAEADVFPTFYRLNTPRSIRNAARSTGLTVVDFRLVNTSALTMVLGPVALLELLWIRFTQLRPLGALRPNIIAVLSKPDTD
jgi:ubiquinone/menaquinone biosynthesis C-methylase UbiE